MHVRTARELGAVIKGRRNAMGWTQQQLAQAVGMSRQWVITLERGKTTTEVGPVLRALTALGVVADIIEAPVPHGGIDLDELVERHRG